MGVVPIVSADPFPLRDTARIIAARCRELGLSPITTAAYIRWIRRLVVFHAGLHPARMSPPYVRSFATATLTGRAASTQRQAVLACIFLFRHILRRPGEAAELHRLLGKQPRSLPQPMTPTDVDTLLEHLDGAARLVARLQCVCGLRLDEAVALRLGDLDLDRATIRVAGRTARTVPLPATMQQDLRAWLQHGILVAPEAPLFPARRHSGTSSLHIRSVQRAYAAACRAAGLARTGCANGLVGAYALAELAAGTSPVALHATLGYRDIHTTLRLVAVSAVGPAAVRSPLDDPLT